MVKKKTDDSSMHENKELLEAIHYSIDWVLKHNAPDGPWLYNYMVQDRNISTVLSYIRLCNQVLKSRDLENTLGFICRMPVQVMRDTNTYRGWGRMKEKFHNLLDYNDTRLSFYQYAPVQNNGVESYGSEFHRFKINEVFADLEQDVFDFYYIELKTGSEDWYERYLYIVEHNKSSFNTSQTF